MEEAPVAGEVNAWAWRLFVCGALVGAVAAVARLPYFPSTAAAQLLAAVGQSPEWSRAAAYGGPAPGLARALAAAPDDAALHLGAAAWESFAAELAAMDEPGWCGNSYRHETFQQRGLQLDNLEARSSPAGPDAARRERKHLDALSRRFPHDASLRSYQLRRLLSGGVWIPRADMITPPPRPSVSPPPPPVEALGNDPLLPPAVPGAVPGQGGPAAPPPLPPLPPEPKRRRPTPQLLERFDAVARAGQRLEPDNGFFAAMRAVAAFAGEQDAAGLRHLHAAAAKPTWNAHALDERRAVWKLLRAAYGDHGVEQLLPSGESVAFPYNMLRAMARVAVWNAGGCERAGDTTRAREIRGEVMRLGLRIRDQSPLLAERLIGDAIFYLAMAPATSQAVARNSASGDSDRRQRRERYAAYLERQGGTVEAAWVRYEGERGDVIQQRIRRARDRLGDHTPYWPPRGLAVWWELGVILLQQLAALLALWAGVRLLALGVDRKSLGAGSPRVGPWIAVQAALLCAPVLVSFASQRGAPPHWQEYAIAGTSMTATLGVCRRQGLCRQRRNGHAPPARPEAQSRWVFGSMALFSLVPSIPLLILYLGIVSHETDGGSSFGLLWWGPPLGFIFPEVIFLPALTLCWLALCWGAGLGLTVGASFCRGVRQVAPYLVALLVMCYLGSSVPAANANAEAALQIELTLTDELAAMEAAR
jgi:hypothetical protein